MKSILIEIIKILNKIPFMDRDTMISIMNPIDNEEQAERMLKFLQDNKDNPEIMDTDYLIPNKKKIIGC